MTKVSEYHSTKPGTAVYHNNSTCTEGNNIETNYRKAGTGGHPLCHHCKTENDKEAAAAKK